LVQTTRGVRAISNLSGADLSPPVREYAKAFFDIHSDIDLFIGKDRSPSCGVRSARLYDRDKSKTLIADRATGLMAKEALARGIEAWDGEAYVAECGVED
jgi:uncharacterized protein YbbK (DUF523 family)